MRTSIVYRPWHSDNHLRAYLPGEAPDESGSKYRTFFAAHFVPAHTESGERITDLDFKHPKPFTRKVPDSLDVHNNVFKFEHGVVERVRVISDEYVDELDRLDREIESLRDRQRQIIEEAWNRSNPISKRALVDCA